MSKPINGNTRGGLERIVAQFAQEKNKPMTPRSLPTTQASGPRSSSAETRRPPHIRATNKSLEEAMTNFVNCDGGRPPLKPSYQRGHVPTSDLLPHQDRPLQTPPSHEPSTDQVKEEPPGFRRPPLPHQEAPPTHQTEEERSQSPGFRRSTPRSLDSRVAALWL